MTGCRIVKHVQVVFSITGGNSPFEFQICNVAFERFVNARLQIVAVGENQTVIFGKKHASVCDRIQSTRRLCFLVEYEVAIIVLFEGFDLQQNDIANYRVVVLAVIERLVGIVDRFIVDA